MLPRVDLPDLILEVMAWHPGFVAAFAGVSGGHSRLGDLHVTIAAALTAHALNVGYVPAISASVPALTRGRISHADQNYLRPENYTAANSVLIAPQDSIELARRWGGGLVAGIDGMRFVVPVRYADAIREFVYVESSVDSDADGVLDRVRVDIIRPKQSGPRSTVGVPDRRKASGSGAPGGGPLVAARGFEAGVAEKLRDDDEIASSAPRGTWQTCVAGLGQ